MNLTRLHLVCLLIAAFSGTAHAAGQPLILGATSNESPNIVARRQSVLDGSAHKNSPTEVSPEIPPTPNPRIAVA